MNIEVIQLLFTKQHQTVLPIKLYGYSLNLPLEILAYTILGNPRNLDMNIRSS